MYAVVLRYAGREHLRLVDQAHRHVLATLAAALRPFAPSLSQEGNSDLVLGDRKVSGNSMRCKRDHLLYHGTLLYGFDLNLMGRFLRMPPRQPEYRAGRAHADFVTNLSIDSAQLRQALIDGFNARQALSQWPRELTRKLATERYSQDAWNFKR
jgi:lipoate-protein ligase A